MSDQQVWLEAVIKHYEQKQSVVKVISLEEKILVGVGENYLSEVKKLVVRVVRGDGEIITESFILKQLPAGFHTREMVIQGGFNFTEFTGYRDVLSSMDLLMKEKGITDEPIWPKCITMKPYDKIVFEDLTACGYKMGDRLEGLDLEHCTLVVQNLGLFHALGLAMKERGCLPNILYGEHTILRSRKEYENFVDIGYKKMLTYVETWGKEWLPALEKLKSRLAGYGNMIYDFYERKNNEFTVLNHGDVWTNNLLFKYNVYTGKPFLMRFLDFQVSFLGSPAHDLTYFLTSSPNLDVRRHYSKALVRIYYDSLLLNMNRLGVTEKPPTFEYIENEMKRLTYLRFHIMTTLLVMITRKSEDTYDMETLLKEGNEAIQKGEALNEDYWLNDLSDHLRSIYQVTIKEAEDDGTL